MPKQSHDEFMRAVAAGLDEVLNGEAAGGERKIGFALLTYEFGKPKDGKVNYIGNGERNDVRVAMKEVIARWEGRYAEPSTAEQ